MGTSKTKLFSEFSPNTAQQWREAIAETLHDAEKRLSWKNREGFSGSPFYRQEDLESLPHLSCPIFPAQNFQICVEVRDEDIHRANRLIRREVQKQAAIHIYLDQTLQNPKSYGDGVPIFCDDDMRILWQDVDLSRVPVFFSCGQAAVPIFILFLEELSRRKISLDKICGGIDNDPIAIFAIRGELPRQAFQYCSHILQYIRQNMPNFAALTVNSHHFHNAGASVTEELACTLATAIEYLDRFSDLGMSLEQIVDSMRFSFSIGDDYFLEIAKLRAAKILWNKIVHAFGMDKAICMSIEGKNSLRNATNYGLHANVLRATTAAMAGIIGGCDSLTISSFGMSDSIFSQTATQVQRILQEEAHLTRCLNAAEGAYYIETLTNLVATSTWSLLRELEQQGGMIQALTTGKIQKMLAETDASRLKNIATNKDVLVGTNLYPDTEETACSNKLPLSFSVGSTTTKKLRKMGDDAPLELDETAFVESLLELMRKGTSVTEISSGGVGWKCHPIERQRTAAELEKFRLGMESFVAKRGSLSTLLILLGKSNSTQAKAVMARNFIGTIGISATLMHEIPDTMEGRELVVLCAEDSACVEAIAQISAKRIRHYPQIVIVFAPPSSSANEVPLEFVYENSDWVHSFERIFAILGIEV